MNIASIESKGSGCGCFRLIKKENPKIFLLFYSTGAKKGCIIYICLVYINICIYERCKRCCFVGIWNCGSGMCTDLDKTKIPSKPMNYREDYGGGFPRN
jgi:hypothetical protein